MVKSILTVVIALSSTMSFAQVGSLNSEPFDGIRRSEPTLGYRRPGTLEASATYSPSTLLSRKSSHYYVSGYAEYHFDRRVSLRSDSYYYLNSNNEFPFIENAIRSYFGILYHLNDDQFSNFDVSVGFQPGVAIMSTTNNTDGLQTLVAIEPSRVVVSPSFALSLGAKFYVWKFFNFFANVYYLNSSMGGIPEGPFNTDEIVVSAGLGFQVQTKGKQ